MRKFFLEHYYLTGFISALAIIIGGSILGLLLGVLILVNDNSQPLSESDPHDGAAMASAMIFNLFTSASLIAGILGGLITAQKLQSKLKAKIEDEEWWANNS